MRICCYSASASASASASEPCSLLHISTSTNINISNNIHTTTPFITSIVFRRRRRSHSISTTTRRISPLFLCLSSSQLTKNYNNCISISSSSSSYEEEEEEEEEEDDDDEKDEPFSLNNKKKSNYFIVVNFYHLLHIQDPQLEIDKHLHFLKGRDIHGRFYFNQQGINVQYSGPSDDAMAYVEWLKEDPRFSSILVQISPAIDAHAFPRLKLQYRPSLVQLEGGTSHLPLVDPSMRASPLEPSEWRKRLETPKENDGNSKLNNSNYILLDVRNGYEWDIGHFLGAQRPDVDCFRSTSFGLSEEQAIASDPLSNVDKQNTDILMYCTGGIRCDIYSTILRSRGFQNLYTLKGGVSNYLVKEGPTKWIGNLFVFDSRLALPPTAYKPESKLQLESAEQVKSTTFGKCYICGSQVCELRHRNCANLDCNLLFLCCSECVAKLRGCCSGNCTSASRLRPVLAGHQRYKKWHSYRDLPDQNSLTTL